MIEIIDTNMNFKRWLEAVDQTNLKAVVNGLRQQYPFVDLFAWETESYVELANIKIAPEHRGQGHGSAIIKAFQNYCQQVGKPLVVRPEPEKPRLKNRLLRFYKSLGFIANKGRNADYRLSTPFAMTMYWQPKKDKQNG
jgi:GNAT superfamily N-acetyltransferase